MGLQRRPEFGQCNTSPTDGPCYTISRWWKRMVLQAGNLVLDTEHRLLHRNGYGGEPIRLTPKVDSLIL